MSGLAEVAEQVAAQLDGDWRVRPGRTLVCVDRADDRVSFHLEGSGEQVRITGFAVPWDVSEHLGDATADGDAECVLEAIRERMLPRLDGLEWLPEGHCYGCGKRIRKGVQIQGSLGPVCSYRCLDG